MRKRKFWKLTSVVLIAGSVLLGSSGCARNANGDLASSSSTSESASEDSSQSSSGSAESSPSKFSSESSSLSSSAEASSEEANDENRNDGNQGKENQADNQTKGSDGDQSKNSSSMSSSFNRWDRKDEKKRFERDGEWESHLIQGSDIHYFAKELTDNGPRFQEMVEYGDGKIVTYIDAITDAFLDEVMEYCPYALILSGDLTLEGEKKSHQELAKKLEKVEDAGIPVLVIPGNHDINNRKAGKYKGTQRMPAEYTTPEEFREIYRNFGYDEALSEGISLQ